MAGEHVNPSPRASDAVQIIVLTHPAAPVPARLLQALQRRGTRVQLVTDAPMVMAELAFASKALVIINQAQRFARIDSLLAAIARFYPQTDCWQFDERAESDDAGGEQPRFVKLELPAAEVEASAGAPTRQSPPRPAAPPLKIAGQPEPDGDDDDIEPLLTKDELEMLLGATHGPRDASASR